MEIIMVFAFLMGFVSGATTVVLATLLAMVWPE